MNTDISYAAIDTDILNFMKYQKELRSKIAGCFPLRWEFRHWLKAAQQQSRRI